MRALAAGLVVALIVACGNNNVLTIDGASDAPSDVLTCGPASVATDAAVPTMHPPNHATGGTGTGPCSSTQIMDYVACDVGQDTTRCSEFQSGQPGATCAACIESQSSAATWGVLVFNGTTATPNIGGCVDDALGQVGAEPNSCGQLLFASYSCQNAACSGCMASTLADASSDFDSCDALAVATVCAGFNAEVQAPTGPCAPLVSDAGLTGPVASCFPDTTIADPIKQETAWLTGIIGFMCGP